MKIIKTSETTPTPAQVVNEHSESTHDSYSCNYINNMPGGEEESLPESWTSANKTNYLNNSSNIKYFKYKNIVSVLCSDVKLAKTINSNGTILASGLPIPISTELFVIRYYDNGTGIRLKIDANGNLATHYTGNTSNTSNEYYGQIVYLTAD